MMRKFWRKLCQLFCEKKDDIALESFILINLALKIYNSLKIFHNLLDSFKALNVTLKLQNSMERP